MTYEGKIAVAILHGAGTPKKNFADHMIDRLVTAVAKQTKKSRPEVQKQLVFEPIFWSSVFEKEERRLWERLKKGGKMDYARLRLFTIEFLADAIAYQPANGNGQNYDKVHAVVAQSMNKLAERAGGHAPLCVISHSLGSVVATNYFLDLQQKPERIGAQTERRIGPGPLEKGETLFLFYTLGSPLALWSLRFGDFGDAIIVPSPAVGKYYQYTEGEWLNIYDRDDVLSYPLKTLNQAFHKGVTRDVEMNVGGLLTSWNPFSHQAYDRDEDVIFAIAAGIARLLRNLSL